MNVVFGGTLIIILLFIGVVDAADDWTQQSPASSPSARRLNDGTAYIGGDQVLLFGGFDGSINLGETWVYDLSDDTWTQQSPDSSPYERSSHGMAYIGGDQVVLFGGYIDVAPWYDNETWVYDLSANTWTQGALSPDPSGRYGHQMAYIGGDQLLLFGGTDNWLINATFVYDLSDDAWTQKFPASSPSARRYHAMAYIGGDQVLLFGGDDGARDDETWVYDLSANTWTQQTPPSSPSGRYFHGMAYLGGDKVVLFGGNIAGYSDETWIYDLSEDSWTQDYNTIHPSARGVHAFSETSMDGSSYPVLFGGQENDGNNDDETWTFGGGDYLLLEPMVLDIELISADTARVSWFAVTGAMYYDLYRNTIAHFNGSGSPWQTVTAPTTQLDFTEGIGDTNTNYYFLGKARSDYLSSPESNTVGEFDCNIGNP